MRLAWAPVPASYSGPGAWLAVGFACAVVVVVVKSSAKACAKLRVVVLCCGWGPHIGKGKGVCAGFVCLCPRGPAAGFGCGRAVGVGFWHLGAPGLPLVRCA